MNDWRITRGFDDLDTLIGNSILHIYYTHICSCVQSGAADFASNKEGAYF